MRKIWIILVSLSALWAQEENIRLSVPYSHFKLDNGLTVILHQDSSTPTVSVNVWYHVGSGREKPGRTGFAHLFEHIMFEGSQHVPESMFDRWLEAAGGDNNGSTSSDRTNYWENIPNNALELALFLESDRMGYLLEAMSPDVVEGQRNVVKNERRQSYENRPYGMAFITLFENLYPANHPYHWPTIGSMQDLDAASYQDVVDFFQTFYGPNNASLAIAGDIDIDKTRQLVDKWFGSIPAGPPVPPQAPPAAFLIEPNEIVLEDKVQLPRIYLAWHSPSHYHPGDAECDVLSSVLSDGKNSRLYKRLVYDLQIAQDVYAYQYSRDLGSSFIIQATARPGIKLDSLLSVIDLELQKVQSQPPSRREIKRSVNQIQANFLRRIENIGGFGGKADQLNNYYFFTGNPDYFQEDLSRYTALDPVDIQAIARQVLTPNRVVLSIVPEGKRELAK